MSEDFAEAFPDSIELSHGKAVTIRLNRNRKALGVRFEADLREIVAPKEPKETPDVVPAEK